MCARGTSLITCRYLCELICFMLPIFCCESLNKQNQNCHQNNILLCEFSQFTLNADMLVDPIRLEIAIFGKCFPLTMTLSNQNATDAERMVWMKEFMLRYWSYILESMKG